MAQNQSVPNLTNYIRKFIVYTLPLFYFLTSVMFYLKTYDSAMIKITILQIGGTIFLCFWLIQLLDEGNAIFKKEQLVYTIPFLLVLSSAIVTFIHSHNKLESSDDFLRKIFYISLAVIVIREINFEKAIKLFAYFIIGANFVSTFYGLIQYLDISFFPPLPERGLDPFIWRQAFGSRIFSTFGNPNFFGDFLVLSLPLIFSFYLKTKNLFLYFMIGLTIFNIILTGTKGAWLGLTADIIVFVSISLFVFPYQLKDVIRVIIYSFSVIIFSYGLFMGPKYSLAFGILGITGVLISFFNLQKFLQKINPKTFLKIFIIGIFLAGGSVVYYHTKTRITSATFRIFTWLSTYEMIREYPILGNGMGLFKIIYPSYRRPSIFHIEGKHNTETDHAENEHIEVFLDEGIVGFGIYLAFITFISFLGLKTLLRFAATTEELSKKKKVVGIIAHDPRAYYLFGFLAGFFGMLLHNFMDVSIRFVSSGVYLWLLPALVCCLCIYNPLPANYQEIKSNNKNLLWLRRILQVVILIICFIGVKIFWGVFKADIHHNIAIAHSKQAQWDEALKNYKEVNRLNPTFIMAFYFKGNVFNDRWGEGDFERAISAYKEVEKLAPNYVQMHHQVGLVYIKMAERMRSIGNEEKAKEYFKEAIKRFEKYWWLDPVFQPNYYRWAYCYIQLGEIDKAIELYKSNIEARECFLGTISECRRNWEEAINEYINYGYTDFLFPEDAIKEASEAIKKGDKQTAEEIYKNRIISKQKISEIFTPLSYITFKSVSNYARFLPQDYLIDGYKVYGHRHNIPVGEQIKPQEAFHQLANAYFIKNDFAEAEKYYLKSLRYIPNYFPSIKNLALLYSRAGIKQKALEFVQAGLRISPNDSELSKLHQDLVK